MTMADELAIALNAYEGDNPWEDVIRAGGDWRLDEAATEAADPQGSSDLAILTDGSAVVYDETRREWVTRSPEWVREHILEPALRRYLSGEDLYAVPEQVSTVWETFIRAKFPALAQALDNARWQPLNGPGVWDPNTMSLTEAVLDYLANANGDEQAAVAAVKRDYEESVRESR
ncbi:MAG: hypothetical protein DIU70_013435 [Bacillota bacterium]|nr:MAG: hypothetical protein DIU70_06680 [Bacillota bacterium]